MEVDLVLVINGDQEGGNVDDAAIDSDVSALDQSSGVVDRVGKLGLENTSLKSSLEQLVKSHGQNVIEPIFSFLVEKAELEHLSEQSSALKESAFVLGIQSQKLSGSLSEAGQHQLNSPNFSLIFQAEFAANLDFLVVTLLFEGTSGLL